jgi:hypothetical protein
MIPLYIPYFNRPDRLEAALASIRGCAAEVYVIDNSMGLSGRSDSIVLQPPFSLMFGQAQNWMLTMALRAGHPFWISMHDDAEASPDMVNMLIHRANEFTWDGKKWGILFTNYDSMAAHSTEAYSKIGGWDKFMPWYVGDMDVWYRLRLAGYETMETGIPVVHHGSESIKNDERTRYVNDVVTPLFREYYRQKWGGDPGSEVFPVPFNLP